MLPASLIIFTLPVAQVGNPLPTKANIVLLPKGVGLQLNGMKHSQQRQIKTI